MSSENEDQCFTGSAYKSKSAPNKLTRIFYTRDFLLSFSDHNVCKKLPAGFETSVLSEFEDASHNIPEWQRVQGGLFSQSLKHSEYGTSPPSNSSRGSQGRWDTRSSGSNDRDGDFQSDRESVMLLPVPMGIFFGLELISRPTFGQVWLSLRVLVLTIY